MSMDAALTIGSAIVVLFMPGFLLLRALGMTRSTSLCAAPAASIALYTFLGEARHSLGLTSGPISLLLLPSIVLGILTICGPLRRTPDDPRDGGVVGALRYAVIGLACFWIIFYRRIPFDTTLMEYYDNVFHYNNVRAIAESGGYSILHALRYYATPADIAIAPWPVSSGFYPYGWHFVCALVMQMSSSQMALVTNSVNFIVCGAVFPLGVALLNEAISPEDPYVRMAGQLVATALTGFPWILVLLWPLYPNSLGLAMVPAAAGLFVIGVRDKTGTQRALYALACMIAVIGAAATHPNSVFTLLLLIIPFLGERILTGQGVDFKGHHISNRALAVLYGIACVGGWLLLYVSPAFRGVVTFNWNTDLTLLDGLHDVLSLGYVYHMFMDEPRYCLAVLAAIGGLSCVKTKNRHWVVGAAVLATIILYGELVLSSENLLKHILAGFWYTDPYRVGASTTICVLPLVTLGLAACLRWLDDVVIKGWRDGRAAKYRNALMGMTCALIVAAIYIPQLPILAAHKIQTPFGDYRIVADLISVNKDVLDRQELSFLAKVNEATPRDAVIINYPFDGSNFAYGALGTRVLYRYIGGYEESPEQETNVSKLIRADLNNVSTNDELRRALADLGDCYVLRLERDYAPDEDGQGSYLGAIYVYDAWDGLLSVGDDTPGLSLVLSEGDYRLYHVDL